MIKTHIKKISIVVLLILLGALLNVTGLLDVDKMLSVTREYAGEWWLIVILIILQILLFTFALAGSLIFWVTAPLYPPFIATLILAAGATLGGVGAYFFSRYMTDEWVKKVEKSHTYKILQNQDNFFALFALRIFPAFPHALVNYSSGVLRVKLSHFIVAAFLGVGIKSYVYADIVYNLTTTASIDDLLNVSTILPLVLLSLITFVGVFIKYKSTSKNIN
ncbi:MAG: VTT domain-containing protein [Woeseiaceae bacterium]